MLDVSMSVFAVQLVFHIIQTAVSMYVMYVMYENPMHGNLTVVCTLLLLAGTAGIFYGKELRYHSLKYETDTSMKSTHYY